MGKDILEKLLADSQNTIHIQNTDIKLVCKAACAMANSNGGLIVVDIEEDKEQDIRKSISEDINPAVPFLTNVIKKDGERKLVVYVMEGSEKPYSTNSSFYVVRGEAVCQANQDEIKDLFDHRELVENSWERNPQGFFDENDVDEFTVSQMRAALAEQNEKFKEATKTDILKHYGFLTDDMINNAGVAVCAENPVFYLPQIRIRVSLFADTQSKSLINVKLFEGNLVESVPAVTNYIYSLYPRQTSIGLLREENEPLPLVALREGILNAVVHRSYEEYNSFLIVNIFSDRLEIINSGELLRGVTVDKLSTVHKSFLRNPDIANAFFRLKYMEMAGTGTLRILSECSRNNCAVPVWKSENGYVSLTFPEIHHNQLALESKDWMLIAGNLSANPSTTKALADILSYIEKEGSLKLNDAQTLTGKSYATVKRYLQLLKDSGLVCYVGSLKTGSWQLCQ